MDTKSLLVQALEREFQLTQIVLERITENHTEWKPHKKSMSLKQLSSRIANLAGLMLLILQESELDFSKASRKPQIFKTKTELLKTFDELCKQVLEFVSDSNNEYLSQALKMRNVHNANEFFIPYRATWIREVVSVLIDYRKKLLGYLLSLDREESWFGREGELA